MPNDFTTQIENTKVPAGAVALWWLGQAGFVFKAGNGTVLYVDPYLSDVVEKAFGFKRLSLAPVDADGVRADWLISSHEHLDHLDTDAIPIIARKNPNCRFAGPESCQPEYDKCGVPNEARLLLEPEKTYDLSGAKLHTAHADHGELSPGALSLLFDFGRVRVLFTGDTALSLERMQRLVDLRPEVLLPCINGRFGNLNAEEAAELTAVVSPRAVVPCHFWMFKEHNGDPEAFVQACARRCPDVPVRLLTPGKGLLCMDRSVDEI
jgi:L-ascorbate 6-phosphate lactonase